MSQPPPSPTVRPESTILTASQSQDRQHLRVLGGVFSPIPSAVGLASSQSMQSEDRLEAAVALTSRHNQDLSREVACLKQGLEAQRAALSALQEIVQKRDSDEAFRTSVDDLQRQQELQAGALRESLMELHNQRKELTELKAHSENTGDVAAVRLEELQTELASLKASLEHQVTEVLRKSSRQRDEFLQAVEAERAARDARFAQVEAALSEMSVGAPLAGGEGGKAESGTDIAKILEWIPRLTKAIERVFQSREFEGAELRRSLEHLRGQATLGADAEASQAARSASLVPGFMESWHRESATAAAGDVMDCQGHPNSLIRTSV